MYLLRYFYEVMIEIVFSVLLFTLYVEDNITWDINWYAEDDIRNNSTGPRLQAAAVVTRSRRHLGRSAARRRYIR